MNFQQQIESKIFGKKTPAPMDAYHFICHFAVTEFKWSFEEINESPSPFVLEMVDRQIKKLDKENKKNRGK